MSFHDRLRILRERKGLTQPELAEKTKIPYRSLQNYEYGISEPKSSVIEKLADYFDVSTDYLLGRTDESVPPPKKFASVERTLSEINNAFVIED